MSNGQDKPDAEGVPAEEKLTEAQQRVLDAAVEVFAERGFHGTSTAEIAKRAGVAEGTIFRHFKTKKDLLFGAVAPLFVRMVTPVMAHGMRELAAAQHPRLEDFLRALFKNRLEVVVSHPRLMRIVVQELPFQPELRDRFKQSLVETLFPIIQKELLRFQQTGQIAPMPPERVGRLIASVFAGYFMARVFISPEYPWNDEEEMEAMLRFITQGLAPPSTR